ncbi:MAG TPA: methyltransferase domain-containing protein [Nocardioidaceae bacterium]|jgi:ubiquinone/menaquinone biosynthesis C-methylase UbiE|nr:methyltransferase domain-containing protein [Nocardioidaceae bacterium]
MAGTHGSARAAGPHAQRRSAVRTAVVWEALQSVLEAMPDAARSESGPARVIDIGGGTGGFAVRAAGLGHRVTVIDPSPDALAALARRADEQGVAHLVTGQQGDLGNLLDLVPESSADVVLCHGVLEVVEDPADALDTIARVLRPGGTLSLLVNQRHAAVVARAMSGHFGQARDLLEGRGVPEGGTATARRFTAPEATELLEHAGFRPRAVHGVRVFADLVPSSLVDLEPGAAEALAELERAASTRPEYLSLAAQLHVIAER